MVPTATRQPEEHRKSHTHKLPVFIKPLALLPSMDFYRRDILGSRHRVRPRPAGPLPHRRVLAPPRHHPSPPHHLDTTPHRPTTKRHLQYIHTPPPWQGQASRVDM